MFDHRALRLLVDTVGPDKVILGSDYPYPLGEHPAGELIRSAPTLDHATRRRLLHDNATAFLGRRAAERLQPVGPAPDRPPAPAG